MNRHHPYGGAYDYPQPRRGTNSPAPGHDRGHRFQDRGGPYRGRGGHHRGRGGYSNNYDSGMNHPAPYEQGPSQQGDLPPYNDYEASYYQGSYADSASFGPPAGYPGYPKYEDGPVYEEPEPRGNRPRPMRRERDDTVHDSIIEERIQRERPCRTLFIRNIKYETNSDDIRRQFEEHGDIKTFFDLISTRGMVFVTYYDLRAAERAKEKLQGSEISGRPIDVHYSLPRDDAKGADREKNQQFQGTLHITLRSSPSGQGIDDAELHRVFQAFGDIRSIKPVNDRIDSRYLEFFDMRSALDAADRLRHQPLQDGIMDIAVAWDNNEGGPPHAGGPGSGGGRDWEDRGHHRGGGGGGGGGRGRGRGRGGRGRHDDYEDRRDRRRDDFGGGRNGRYDDDRGGRGGGGGYDRYGPPPPDRYGPPPGSAGGPSHYPPPPLPVVPPASNLDVPPVVRLEQAKKVQELLAALKPDSVAPAGPAPPAQPGSYYPPPPPASYPPAAAYTGALSAPPVQPPAATNPSLAGLPPGILALLQNAQSQAQSSVPPVYGAPPPMGVTPPSSTQSPPNPAHYQHFMTYLQQNAQGAKQ